MIYLKQCFFHFSSIGMSDADVHAISTVENPGMSGNRFTGGSSDDSSQSSAAPMTGLVQPQQPHWPQHNTGHNHHHLHSSSYLLDGDDDLDDFDYDEYGGSGPSTPGGPSSPASSTTRSKRGSSTKRLSQTGARKSTGGSGAGSGANSTTPPTGNRRQQYTLAELPFVCEFCPARYKTKPGLQYHLAKHKETNTDYRPSPATPSTADSAGSSSPSSSNAQGALMKQKYMNSPMDHPQPPLPPPPPPPPQHPMYGNQPPTGPPMQHNNPGISNI